MTERQNAAIKGLEASYVGLACVDWAKKIIDERENLEREMEIAKKYGDLNEVIRITARMVVASEIMSMVSDISDRAKEETENVRSQLGI